MAAIETKDPVELVTTDGGRLSVYPLSEHPVDKQAWINYRQQQDSFWVSGKFNWMTDAKNFPLVPRAEQLGLIRNFAFTIIGDSVAGDSIEALLHQIKWPEFRDTYIFAGSMENTHHQTYNAGMRAMIPDEKKIAELLEETKRSSQVAAMWRFARENIQAETRPLRMRIAALGIYEGVMFSANFAYIDWLKSRGYKLPDLYSSNLEISRDEARHMTTGALLHQRLSRRCSEAEFREIADIALGIVNGYIDEMIPPEGFVGLDRDKMKLHASHCTHICAELFGFRGLYHTAGTPLREIMSYRAIRDVHTNNFERDNTEYSVPSVDETKENNMYESDDRDF